VNRLVRRAPPVRYRRTEGVPRLLGLHRRALRRTGSDDWVIYRAGQPLSLVAAIGQGPWWAHRRG
jgi:hypothetical protein